MTNEYKKVGKTDIDPSKKTKYVDVYRSKNKKDKYFYKKVRDKFVRLPRNTKVISSEKDKGTQQARGREVSIRESSSYAQLIYGRMRVGGVYSYFDTSQESRAYLVSGSGNASLLFNSVGFGSAQNAIAVQITSIGTNPTLTVTVPVANLIVIALKSTGGTPESTRDQVIAAYNLVAAATALCVITRTGADGNGIVQPMAQTNLSYGGGNWLHNFITLAIHEIDEIESLYLDNRLVTFGASPDPRWAGGSFSTRVFMAKQLGTAAQTVQPDLNAQLPSTWTTNHRQRNCAGAYIITSYDQNTFADGLPEIEFIVRGKKVLDTRTSTTAWSQNAALIIADYMMDTRFGMGISLSNIDTTTLNDSANCCDESVSLLAGGTESRYTINGIFDTSMSHQQVLEEMALAIAGDIVYQGGKWFIYAGKYRNATVSITEDDFRGPIRISTKVSARDSYNGVKGTYINPAADYEENEFPVVKSDTYIADDGRKNYLDVALTCVQSSARAQRIARIFLERNRQQIEFSAPMAAGLIASKVCDVILVSFAKYGWVFKPFEIRDFQIRHDSDAGLGCDVVFRETASGIYNDTMSETNYDLAPNTTLPNPYIVTAISGLTLASGTSELYLRNDGTVFSRLKVSWTAPNDLYVTSGGRYVVEYKKTADSTWLHGGDIPSSQTSIYILDVDDGLPYDVRVKAVNTIGVSSAWTQSLNYTVLGKTVPPTAVSSLTATLVDFGIIISWAEISDIDLRDYEVRVGASWGAGAQIFKGKGNQYKWEHKTAGTYNFWIKAYDTSGNAQTTETAATALVISAPSTPTVSAILDGPNIKLSWTASTASSAIKEYEIRQGSTYALGTLVAIVTGLNFSQRVNWGGSRTFWVAARDIASNTGTAGGATQSISSPNVIQNFLVTTIDNNVLLDWDDPVASSLPIAEYRISKGATYAGSVSIGTVYGSFHTYIEKVGGDFIYWVVPVDTAGNAGTQTSFSATITPPDDYILRSNIELINNQDPAYLSETLIAAVRVPTSNPDVEEILLPIITSGPLGFPLFLQGDYRPQTWDEWWTAAGWTTWADAIAAGWNADFPTPNITSGSITWQVDYETLISGSFIALTWERSLIGDDITLTPTISISTDGSSWTDYAGSSEVYSGSFRYVKYKLAYTSTTGIELIKLTSARAIVSLKQSEENHSVVCGSTDTYLASNGTGVVFDKSFISVFDIQATAQGTTFANVVVDFTSIPNPTYCRVLVFDAAGARMSATVNVRIKGALNT